MALVSICADALVVFCALWRCFIFLYTVSLLKYMSIYVIIKHEKGLVYRVGGKILPRVKHKGTK